MYLWTNFLCILHKHILVHLGCHSITKTKQWPLRLASAIKVLLAFMFWTPCVFLLLLGLQLMCHIYAISSSTSSFAKWHHHLAHICWSCLSSLIDKGCLGHTSIESSFHCKGCKLGKQIQLPYFSNASSSSFRPFGLIHLDVWGPAPFATKGGHKYYVIFINDHSRYTWVYLMKHHSQLCSIYQTFVRIVHTQFSTPIRVFSFWLLWWVFVWCFLLVFVFRRYSSSTFFSWRSCSEWYCWT